ncbi:hypothetical protein PANDA_004433 [Ailuropoda melanoleuca]|uniref:Ras-GEF domain-containing protein n=1 Tax=Ailuropoda melanoleuca TaxID=9646 RepID=D2H3X8_AILME|nr:hypothetical protein PANDA_004433 [Ailuropoda melanoleuca]
MGLCALGGRYCEGVVASLRIVDYTALEDIFQLLNRKDKTTFEKLDYLMSKEDNYKRTREYIRSLKMVPSIPYLVASCVSSAIYDLWVTSIRHYMKWDELS